MASASLIKRAWLKREFEVSLGDADAKTFVVMYSGRGLGFETVWVDSVVASQQTRLEWFVPRFEFLLGASTVVVEVRVWPWLAIRSFRLFLDGELLYSEGA